MVTVREKLEEIRVLNRDLIKTIELPARYSAGVEQEKREEALGRISAALEGFKFEPIRTNHGSGFHVWVKTIHTGDERSLFVLVKWYTRQIQHARTLPTIHTRRLEVSVGKIQSEAEFRCDPDNFVEEFAAFLMRESYTCI